MIAEALPPLSASTSAPGPVISRVVSMGRGATRRMGALAGHEAATSIFCPDRARATSKGSDPRTEAEPEQVVTDWAAPATGAASTVTGTAISPVITTPDATHRAALPLITGK